MSELEFYRYVSEQELLAIKQSRLISLHGGQTCKWYTPDRYESAEEAQRYLALAYRPRYRIGPIPAAIMPDFDRCELRVVGPAYGQPGGGFEAATSRECPLPADVPMVELE